MTQPSDQLPNQLPGSTAGRIIAGVFGLAFFGIGLTVLAFLWFAHDEVDGAPIFFRIVGSFIALVFVVFGGTMAFSAITNAGLLAKNLMPPPRFPGATSKPGTAAGSYLCPHCGASLTGKVDVSPMGDVKCPFCGSWFNIHNRSITT